MRLRAFCMRTAKEILRDPLNIIFGLGFPLVVLFLLTAIQANIPESLFELEHLTPGVAVFGLSFISLFAATLVSKDRESALLQRLYTTPLRASDYILGYILPMLPIALMQSVVCYLAAICLGLSISWNILYAIAFLLPTALVFIALGVLCGSVLGSKQASGMCGGLLTNLTAWLSGTWFDLSLVGSVFEGIASVFPFVHAVELGRAALGGNFVGVFPHLYVVLGYALGTLLLAIWLFLRQMKSK